jgi:hypothetical protein
MVPVGEDAGWTASPCLAAVEVVAHWPPWRQEVCRPWRQ